LEKRREGVKQSCETLKQELMLQVWLRCFSIQNLLDPVRFWFGPLKQSWRSLWAGQLLYLENFMFQYEIGRNWIKKGKGSLCYSAQPRRSCHRAACRPPPPSGTACARIDMPPSSWRARAGAGTAGERDPAYITWPVSHLLPSSPPQLAADELHCLAKFAATIAPPSNCPR
jgi:hypothetical protein